MSDKIGRYLAAGGQELDEIAMVDGFDVSVITLHAEVDALGGPYTHALGLQFRQSDAAGTIMKQIAVFFSYIHLFPEEGTCPLKRNAPGFFFDHGNHLPDIIAQKAKNGKVKSTQISIEFFVKAVNYWIHLWAGG